MIETGSLDRYESSLRRFSRNDCEELKYNFLAKPQNKKIFGDHELTWKIKKVKGSQPEDALEKTDA